MVHPAYTTAIGKAMQIAGNGTRRTAAAVVTARPNRAPGGKKANVRPGNFFGSAREDWPFSLVSERRTCQRLACVPSERRATMSSHLRAVCCAVLLGLPGAA